MSRYKGKFVSAGEEKFKLIRQIGSGGGGLVWLARSEKDHKDYAVKILQFDEKNKPSKEKIARFQKEIEFCQKQNHPNIIKILGHGELEDKSKYYVMPFYEKTLRNIITQDNDAETLLEFWIKLAEAVEYIHSINIYHRDIKPENIFINNCGDLVLADFGIAHFANACLTKTNEWLGNKSYAAPEQLEKENENAISAACDTYALGKILNELFTRRNPSGLNFTRIYSLHPHLWALDDIVDQCLYHTPAKRPTVKKLLEMIAQIRKEIKEELENIEDVLRDDIIDKHFKEEILNIAAKDIYLSQYILGVKSLQEIEECDPNYTYHLHIHYAVDNFVKSMYFQKRVLQLCENKFTYESNVYTKDIIYPPIDLSKEENQKIYDEFMHKVLKYHYPSNFLGKIQKYFLSCCDYHCKELLNAIDTLEYELEDLGNAPFYYLMYKLRVTFSLDEIAEYDIAHRITVNWALSDNHNVKN